MIIVDDWMPPEEFEKFNYSFDKLTATWVDKDSRPIDYWSNLTHNIWNYYNFFHKIPKECVGYEYWSNYITKGTELNWHLDKDEYHLKQTDELKVPMVGSIFYPDFDFDGGYLEVSYGDCGRREIIAPKPNRLVFLDVGYLEHRVTEVSRGLRGAFSTNMWDYKIVCGYKEWV